MGTIAGISGPDHIQTKQLRIASLASENPKMVFTSLAHYIDVHWMYEAYRRTKKGGATGVDEQSSSDFEKNLTENLKDLVEKFKSGNYKAPPVRRIYLEKGDGKKRPIGIPTFSDKVLQRAVTMVLEPLYERDFYDFSYGFRPKKSTHEAVDAVREHLRLTKGGWIVEIDISGFFDNISHGHIRNFLDRRVRDGVVRRAIDKWLNAGIMEDGNIQLSCQGTPQGGVISPLAANIFLHELVDKWFMKEVVSRVRGARMFRYADDIVMTFRSRADAERVLRASRKRFEKYELALHPEKTKIVKFLNPVRDQGQRQGSIDFLGFTLYWRKGRKGRWGLWRKTRKEKLRKSLREVYEWCKEERHRKVAWQHEKLSAKLKGHYEYFGVTGNWTWLNKFYDGVCRAWQKWLNRRSQKKHLSKKTFYERLRRNPLPLPRIVRGNGKSLSESPDPSGRMF